MKLEKDVRLWLKKAVGSENIFWVESAKGATHGLPDAYLVAENGVGFWLELKMGKVANGTLSYGVSREQRGTIKRLLGRGAGVCFMVGLQGTDKIILLTPTQEVLNGKLHYKCACAAGGGIIIHGPPAAMTDNEFLGLASAFATESSVLRKTRT